MRDVIPSDLATLRRHEDQPQEHDPLRLGGYHMDKVSPPEDFQIFKAVLDAADVGRFYLLIEFSKYTKGGTALLRDVKIEDVVKGKICPKRVDSFRAMKADLRLLTGREVVLVTPNAEAGPLVLIDGNHRSIAQFDTHKTVDGIPAFVCVHPRILEWDYIPTKARQVSNFNWSSTR